MNPLQLRPERVRRRSALSACASLLAASASLTACMQPGAMQHSDDGQQRDAPAVGDAGAAAAPLTRALFDAFPFESWQRVGGAAQFELLPPANGSSGPTLVGKGPIDRNGFLASDRPFSDFRLAVEVRIGSSDNPMGDRMNSGIQIRSAVVDGTIAGLQIEIDPSDRAWSGGVYHERGRGWLASLEGNEAARRAFRRGEWNRYEIECIGPRVRTRVNGIHCAEWFDGTASGLLAFQVHGGPACEVAFRAPVIEVLGAHVWMPARAISAPDAPDGSAACIAIPADCRGFRMSAPAGAEIDLLDREGALLAPGTVRAALSARATADSGKNGDSALVRAASGSAVEADAASIARNFEVLWLDGEGVVLVDGRRTSAFSIEGVPASVAIRGASRSCAVEFLVRSSDEDAHDGR